ncbi:hypothetical protein Gpo141_00012578 [Globisporangium polare]
MGPSALGDRRSSRASSLSQRQSRASSSSLERRGSIGSLKGLLEVEAKPSPTALCLKSLARAVRASQTLGTSSVRKKYMLRADEFSTEEMNVGIDVLMMINDATAIGTAPWASTTSTNNNNDSQRFELTGRLSPISTTASVKSKARWRSAGKAAGQLTARGSNNEANGGSKLNLSPAKSAGLRRSNEVRASKSGIKRLGSIRGDLSMILNGGVNGDTQSSPQPPPAQRSGLPQNLDARIFCARSLYKLSCQVGTELAIVKGGAIAQIADFSDVEHPKLLRFCAATLANLTTDNSVMEAFVKHEGIQALLEISWAPCLHVKILCATALCRITQHAGLAQALVRSRVIIELLSMLTLPHDQLRILAVSSIMNLIFHGHLFPERVFLGEPHAVQNQLGVMSVVSQLATMSTSMHFAAEVLFNLSLYRVSCLGALRGGGAEVLHALATRVCKVMEETGNSSSRYMSAMNPPTRSTRPAWATNSAIVMRILFLIAETLGNFSAYVEFHGILSSHGMKTLSLLLFGALRDVGSKLYGAIAEERLKNTVVACSRTLANFSANDELRKHAFSQEIIHMTTRLTLLDRQKFVSCQEDARVYFRNIIRTICNLSFNDTCTAYFMEFPQVLPLLHAIAIAVNEKTDLPEVFADTVSPRMNLFTDEDVKEDALVTILNLAQQAAYSNDLIRILDGKCLAIAAEDRSQSGRLKYIYSLVLCNLLFESRLQQIVYGDLVIRSLVYGFHFFGTPPADTDDGGNAEQLLYKSLNLAFGDDQERFLAAICIMASEIMDSANIERIIGLILDCLKRTSETNNSIMTTKVSGGLHKPQRVVPVCRRQITCFAAAALYTLTRASTQRGDTNNLIYSPDIEATLILVCERTSAAIESTNNSQSGGGPSATAFCGTAQAFCAATLYHLCASGHVNRRIIQALINCCNANEETLSLLACAASFAIISFTPEGRSQLVACEHLAQALNRLGRTSQPECQQYAAIAACNVSTLQCIWTSTELKDFIVMALLRANSVQAKQIHAKTLSNLLSHLSTREKAVEDGVLYALMKLSQVMLYRSASAPQSGYNSSSFTLNRMEISGEDSPRQMTSDGLKTHTALNSMDEVFSIGLQALFNLSCEHQYHQRLLSNGVMAYLAAAVAGKQATPHSNDPSSSQIHAGLQSNEHLLSASSFLFTHTNHHHMTCHLTAESRRYAMGIICNLSSYDESHKDLMNAQVTDIIRKYVDQDIETRTSAAMALRNLSCKQPWVEMLCERKTLHLFIGFTQCDHQVVKQFAVEALANCSLITDSLHLYGELRVARAVLTLLERASSPIAVGQGKSSDQEDQLNSDTETCMAALKCLHNIAFDDALALNLMNENAILRLLPLLEHRSLGVDDDACLLIAKMVNILAGKPKCAEPLLRQRVVSLCALLHRQHTEDVHIAYECVGILMKLSTYQQIQESLSETQAIHVIVSICSSPFAGDDLRIRECGAITIRNLTLSVAEHLSLFYGDSGLEGAENELRQGDSDGTEMDNADRAKLRNLRKIESSSTEHDDFDSEDVPDESRVSRLIERHLLHGVRHFQRELECLQSPVEVCNHVDLPISDRILHEACAGIANLSTIKTFRVAMVRIGIIDTLLHVYQCGPQPHAHSQSSLLKRICSATLHRLVVEDEAVIDDRGLLVPSLLSILKISDEELHHVRYECEKVSLYNPNSPSRGCRNTRVKSILSNESTTEPVTRRSSAELRANGRTRASSRTETKMMSRRGSIMVVGGGVGTVTAGLTHVAMAATTHCVKQTYREQKWMLLVLKTTLSSASMVPPLEKKQMKTIGQPRLSFQDINSATATAAAANSVGKFGSSASLLGASANLSSMSKPQTTAPAALGGPPDMDTTTTAAAVAAATTASGSLESTVKPRGGYLLPVHMDKYMVRHDECTGHITMAPMLFGIGDSVADDADNPLSVSGVRLTSFDTNANLLTHRDAPDLDAIMQARKFDRHMRSTRRSHRRNPSSLPVLSPLS